MKKFITMLLIIIFALSLSNFNALADEASTISFTADLIADGKLIPVTTKLHSDVQLMAIDLPLYDAIYNGLELIQKRIDVSSLELNLNNQSDVNNMIDTYSAVVNENPDLFYINATFSVNYNTNTGHITHILPSYMENIPALKAEFEQKTAEILSKTIREGMSDEEKLLSIHDYIVHESEYNYGEQTMEDHTAYGIIVKKLGVCQSYALAYNYLLSLVGIESKFCASDPMVHGWSTVKLNNNWYHVDITWDDPHYSKEELNSKGLVIHDYFLLSDEALADEKTGKHYDWVVDVECTDTTYESKMPYQDDPSRHLDLGNNSHYTGYYPMYQFRYNENDGLFYSLVEPDHLNVYFKTNFDGSDFEYITTEEYQAAVGIPEGLSAYKAINMTETKAYIANKNNMSNVYVTFDNNSNTAFDGKMIIAQYDSNNKLIYTETKDTSFTANDSKAVNITPTAAKGVEHIKVLIWNTNTLTEILNTPVEF